MYLQEWSRLKICGSSLKSFALSVEVEEVSLRIRVAPDEQVVQYRMQSEYGVETQLEPLSFSVARWVTGGWPAIEKVGRIYSCATVKDQVREFLARNFNMLVERVNTLGSICWHHASILHLTVWFTIWSLNRWFLYRVKATINLRADLHVLHLSAVGAPCSAVPEWVECCTTSGMDLFPSSISWFLSCTSCLAPCPASWYCGSVIFSMALINEEDSFF